MVDFFKKIHYMEVPNDTFIFSDRPQDVYFSVVSY